MFDFGKLPIAKLVLIIFVFLLIFYIFNNQIHWSFIDDALGCEGLLDSEQVDSCKKEIENCLRLPEENQRKACFSTAAVNSGLIVPFEIRFLVFFVFLVLVVFWGSIIDFVTRRDDPEKDVPKESDAILKKKIIEQLGVGRPDRNYMKNVKIDFGIFKRNRAGFAFFSGTGLESVDRRMCVIDPRKGVKEPVKSPLETLAWFKSEYGKDFIDGLRLASLEEIAELSLPVRDPNKDKEKEKENVVVPSEQFTGLQQTGGGVV